MISKETVLKILVSCWLFPASGLAQISGGEPFLGKNLPELRAIFHGNASRLDGSAAHFPMLLFKKPHPVFSQKSSLRLVDLPPAFCEADLAFFCRLELKMERGLKTNVRFRLGSASYVDWLEGKSSARFMDFQR